MASTPENHSLLITEIYSSIQGESTFAGRPCVFVRLTGCPLRCRWCDTAYGFTGGATHSITSIVQQVKATGIKLVEITGGEPLAQAGCIKLMAELHAAGLEVICETGGSESIAEVPDFVTLIMDIKCPDSKMVDRNLWSNLDHLKSQDEIKFVIASRGDFDWAVATADQHDLFNKHCVLVSPAFGLVQPDELVEWLLASGRPFRFNLQQHKYIWSPRAKGV